MVEGRANVVIVKLELVEQFARLGAPVEARFRFFRERQEERPVAPPKDLGLPGVLQTLERVSPDRLEHPEALAGVADEALHDERLQGVEIRAGDPLRRLEGAAAGEDGQAGEEALLSARQQVVAPLDRGAQRLLARLCVAATLQQVEALGETFQYLRR